MGGYGPDVCAVGVAQTVGRAEDATQTAWSSVARHSAGGGGRVMDFAHRSPMGGATERQVSAVPDLPSPLPALGAGGHAGPGLADTGRGAAGARAIGFVRNFHRCLLQQCEKGGGAVGPTRRGKGTKIMAIADRRGFPVAVGIASASPHETQLVEPIVEQRFTAALPGCMIGDRAYDSDPLDARLQQQHGVALIAPHKSNRSRPKTQDGRRLRRYCRRWKIERLFAWLHNFRRLVTRCEYYEANFLGLVQFGCILILMRNYL